MFESKLRDTLKRIFQLDRATYDQPGETQEQEVIFINVETSRNVIKDAVETAKVTGKIRVFANHDKLPYGYFSKCIAAADPSDTKDLFFYNLEENANTFLNISERTLSFIYFFSGQYNPEVGSMTSINISEAAE